MDKKETDVVASPVTSSLDEHAGGGHYDGVASNGNLLDDGLQRGLKGRHMQMIALGGVVG